MTIAKEDGRTGNGASLPHRPSRIFNAYGFHLRYRAAMRASRDDAESTETEIAERLAVSRSTLYRLRVDFDCPRGSIGLTDAELDALRPKIEQT